MPCFLFFLTLAVCIVPNVALSVTEDMSIVQRVTNVVLPLGVYWLFLLSSRNVCRTVLFMFPVMFFAAFQIVLLYLYGRSVISVDMLLNVVTTNSVEVAELLDNMVPILATVAILYLPPVIMGICGIAKRRMLPAGFRKVNLKRGGIVSASGLVLLALCYLLPQGYMARKDLFPVNVGYNICLAVERSVKTSHQGESSAGYSFHARGTHDGEAREVYVLVVGETSRACNWGMFGYGRPTDEPLSENPGIVGFPLAFSQSNTTHKSVPMLLSHLDANSFGDSIYNVKSIVTAFKEAGFRTAFFSNQRRNHSFIDFFGEEADTCLFLKDGIKKGEKEPLDEELLECVKSELSREYRCQLIVLHTYGSHFCYTDRYAAVNRVFTPDAVSEVTPLNRKALVNAYDNSIRETACLLAGIADCLQSENINAAMLYTSDHGEDIYDDARQLFLHASPCPSYYQLHVPFIVWMSEGYRAVYPENYEAARANKGSFVSSTTAFFHTALDLAGIETPALKDNCSVSNKGYRPAKPLFLNDYNEAVSLRNAGLTELDYAVLDSLSVPYD